MSNEAASPFDLAVERGTLRVYALPTDTRAEQRLAVERVTAPGVCVRLAGALAAGAVATPFQSATWLAALDAVLAPARAASIELLWVSDAASHDLIVALPIAMRRVGGLRAAEIADLGVADYQAPLLGPSAPAFADAGGAAAIAVALRQALPDVDLLRFEKMPAAIGDRANPLAHLVQAHASRFSANRLQVPDTVEAFIASRGKKYRKEAERCFRRIAEAGEVRFERASSPDEIAAAYAQLEAWQSMRHNEAGHVYALDDADLSRFYRDLALAGAGVREGAGAGAGSEPFASLFTLSVGDRFVAILYGVEHAGTFTLLRIADAGAEWKHVSPGRLVVIETMRHMVARGVRDFDMGIGDYPFKRWIGCSSELLFDAEIALTWRALPLVAAAAARRRLRESPHMLALVRRLRGAKPATRPTPEADTADA